MVLKQLGQLQWALVRWQLELRGGELLVFQEIPSYALLHLRQPPLLS
jgi:hypothetical protein